jgi:hypothetical protein
MTLKKQIEALLADHQSIKNISDWPPDTFAVAASLLSYSGLYCGAVGLNWGGPTRSNSDLNKLEKIGKKWREAAGANRVAPTEVKHAFSILLKNSSKTLQEICCDRELVVALFDLIAMADEACKNVSYPSEEPFRDKIHLLLLEHPNTICERIRPDAACVLPKIHTPQTGLTLRSLTHHLALLSSAEVKFNWYTIPSSIVSSDVAPKINLLAIPFPYQLETTAFKASKNRRCGRSVLPSEFGFFDFVPPPAADWIRSDFAGILDRSLKKEKDIHGVIFPETCFSSEEEYSAAQEEIAKRYPDAFLLAGLCLRRNGVARNLLRYSVPLQDMGIVAQFEQSKHHRWKLEETQIAHYDLPLDRGQFWWEHIDVSSREVNFVATRTNHTFSFLICEDLARQEPVAPLIRAIGPHLVVALLQDGPQLSQRWPSRYATVLSEDPGSAVLTLTSAGMALLGNSGKHPVSVGLWRDQTQTRSLDLKKREKALLLKIRSDQKAEYSADSRKNADSKRLTLRTAEPII